MILEIIRFSYIVQCFPNGIHISIQSLKSDEEFIGKYQEMIRPFNERKVHKRKRNDGLEYTL